jgi:hypothetical protein
MRSRGEWSLRLTAIGLLGWALWRALQPVGPAVERADARALRAALIRWTVASPPPSAVGVVVDDGAGLSGYARQWLAALRRNGTRIGWHTTTPLVASAVDAEPIAAPHGGTRVTVAAPAGATVAISDALGPLDSVRAMPGGHGITAVFPASLHAVDAVVGGTAARGVVTDSLSVRRILVLAPAAWESKFIVRALEEDGWIVDLRLRVGPQHDVTQGQPGAIDTARYSAVLALDSSARLPVARLATYVKSGGGLIELIQTGGPRDTVLRQRLGLGRIAQVGYADTWRWRMADGDSGVARHRAWWSGLVSSVAYAPRVARRAPADADAAPLAHLIDVLGPPTPAGKATASPGAPVDPTRQPWVFGALLAALLLEWASRRLRGTH